MTHCVSDIKKWMMAVRAPSLVITICPVLIGTAMAYGDGIAHWPAALAALFGGVMIHAGTNLTNDYCDLKRGADAVGKIDPMRVFPVGTIRAQEIKTASFLAFSLAVPACLYLIVRGGLPLLIIAVLSFLCGIFYTAGRRPLGYMGLGEIFVFLFFGPIAVCGTYYVQSFEMNAAVFWAGFAPGLISTSVLVINNIRDMEGDRQVQKKTLAVRFGKTFSFYEYLFLVLGFAFVPVLIYAITQDHVLILFSSATVFLTVPLMIAVLTKSDEAALNLALTRTIPLLILYSVLFSLGWIV